jgi:hypothetical protein
MAEGGQVRASLLCFFAPSGGSGEQQGSLSLARVKSQPLPHFATSGAHIALVCLSSPSTIKGKIFGVWKRPVCFLAS